MDSLKKSILIVDDVAVNRKTIAKHLAAMGYETMAVETGKTALETAAQIKPALILLDILLPDMNGIDVCRHLKADKATERLPVIFLSSLEDTETKTLGFEAGGVDYINKPVDPRELVARVRTHLTLQEQQQRIATYADTLEAMVSERDHLLVHADRLATLGTFSAAVAHEINNPVTYIMGNVELLKHTWKVARPILENHLDEDGSGHLNKAVGRVDKKLELILDGAQRVSELVADFRAYSRQTEMTRRTCRLTHIVKDASNLLLHRVKRGYRIQVDVPRDIKISANQQKLSQVFVNLFNNAMDAMGNTKGTIEINALRRNGSVDIVVRDDGPGIDPGSGPKIFEPYFTTKEAENGTGLGLYIVRSIIEEHDGTIDLAPCAGNGAQFQITLPAPDEG